MAFTYEPIATSSPTGNTVTLSSIPQTYTDLRLVVNGSSTTSTSIFVKFNGDTGTNYHVQGQQAVGAGAPTVASASAAYLSGAFADWNPTYSNTYILDIFNYTTSSKTKSGMWSYTSAESSGRYHSSGGFMWNNTSSGINSIQVYLANASYSFSNTTITIFGILKG